MGELFALAAAGGAPRAEDNSEWDGADASAVAFAAEAAAKTPGLCSPYGIENGSMPTAEWICGGGV